MLKSLTAETEKKGLWQGLSVKEQEISGTAVDRKYGSTCIRFSSNILKAHYFPIAISMYSAQF